MSKSLERIHKYTPLCLVYKSLSLAQRKGIQRNLTLDQVKFLSEICFNCQALNCQITDEIKNKLKRYKNSFKYVANPKNSLIRKRKILMTGGLASLLLSVLANYLIPTVLEKLMPSEEKK